MDPDVVPHADAASVRTALGLRTLTLVGMMGAGKTSVGKRLAARLEIPFHDSDHEIEAAAGMSIAEIFEKYGEADFRSCEARVIARLLDQGPQVLATGGGAYMNVQTRDLLHARGLCVWLKADFDVLMRRVRRRGERPLLRTPDPEATLKALMDQRYPVYSHADLTIVSRDVPHEVIVEEVIVAVRAKLELES